ncbi:MAG TPA: putative glycolipid-binding domain-containing protein [Gemmatimonadaceae bacterium]|nr:putative glycolipid-binding domain-containing protein [Gemmatimonadaceae bacterium]
MNHTIVWRRIDKPGHEYSRLSELEGGGAKLGGVAVFSNDDTPHCIEYEILCDASWRTLRCRIAEHSGGKRTDHDIRREGNVWTLNGVEVPGVSGAEDVDLEFSPSTNLLPVRRLSIQVGDQVAVRAAWVRFPEFTVEPLDQTYTRLTDETYRYESAVGAFRRDLKVDENGFVLDYPQLWVAESRA